MNRRVLNGRFAAILAVVLIGLGGGVHLLHGMQLKRTVGGLRERSEREEKAGRTDKAEDYLARYLVYRPNDVEALERYC